MLLDGSRPWLDPGATSLNRLPVRAVGVPCPDEGTARRHDPGASPWWRSLDGTWDFSLLDGPGDLTADHLGGGPLDGEVEVPGAWTLQGHRGPIYTNVVMPFGGEPPGVPEDNPTAVYRRGIEVPADWAGRRTVLRVGGAESMVFAYLDGAPVGWSTDSRLAADLDLTPYVTAGRSHTLALVVLRWSAASWLEDQDQWWHGGLQRSVTLFSTAMTHVARAKLVPGARLEGIPRPGGHVTGTLGVELHVAGAARTEPGWTAEVRVETLEGRQGPAGREGRGREGRAEQDGEGGEGRPVATTGALAVPHWDDSGILAQVAGAMLTEPGTVRCDLEVPGVEAWSAESPTLYRALVVLRDPSGEVAEASAARVGFRTVEVRDRRLLVNGAPVVLRGVNVHEHDPRRGRAVDRAQAARDLRMVKAANLNAVRAAHYPHDEHFAELCDELGLYLVDEANVESHARQWSLCHDPSFAGAVVERVERMARRDVHHPSVIVWSLGNESGYGPAHDEAAAFLRRWDPSRPVQYEGPFMPGLSAEAPVSDVVCPMYTSVSDIVAWAEEAADPRRPLILCEYSHAMGNSCGSLVDYDDAFESHEGLQGGFVWEWVSHGLLRELAAGWTGPAPVGPDGRPAWGYGGDFGDDPAEGHFVLDGLVDADRHAHPTLEEVAHLGRPVRCRAAGPDDRPGGGRQLKLVMENRRWFTDTSDLVGEWDLAADGEVVASGTLPVRPIPPRSERSTTLRWPARAVVPGAEHVVTLRWRQAERTPWAPKAAVVAREQIPVHPPIPRIVSPRGHDRHDRAPLPLEGLCEEWTPTVFRALTDNDGIRTGWMRGSNGSLARWVDQQGLDRCTWDRGTGELTTGNATVIPVESAVEDVGNGWRRLLVDIELPAELDDPPRLGITWVLPSAMDRVEWFGDGPHECYPDRRASALLGRWRSTVRRQYEPWGMPQEHGHHTGLRWVALSGDGAGVLVVGDGTGGFSARHHGDAELWAARHADDLVPFDRVAHTFLSVDVAQRGVGQSSLGEEARDEFRIRAGRHRLELLVRGLRAGDDPAEAYASRPR